jgi:hypothetical protein
MSKILAEDWPELTEDIERLKVQAALGIAWQDAEAVLPEGWSLLIGDNRRYGRPGWWATASEPHDEARGGFRIISSSEGAVLYDDPAAALRALAAKLRESRLTGFIR